MVKDMGMSEVERRQFAENMRDSVQMGRALQRFVRDAGRFVARIMRGRWSDFDRARFRIARSEYASDSFELDFTLLVLRARARGSRQPSDTLVQDRPWRPGRGCPGCAGRPRWRRR